LEAPPNVIRIAKDPAPGRERGLFCEDLRRSVGGSVQTRSPRSRGTGANNDHHRGRGRDACSLERRTRVRRRKVEAEGSFGSHVRFVSPDPPARAAAAIPHLDGQGETGRRRQTRGRLGRFVASECPSGAVSRVHPGALRLAAAP
jgi:hypothetical protein